MSKMFGGGAKKKQPTKPRPAGTSLSSFGLMDVPGTDEFGNISLEQPDDDDEDLEAELHAIAYGNSKTKKPIKKKQIVSENELQNMVDLCMQGNKMLRIIEITTKYDSLNINMILLN